MVVTTSLVGETKTRLAFVPWARSEVAERCNLARTTFGCTQTGSSQHNEFVGFNMGSKWSFCYPYAPQAELVPPEYSPEPNLVLATTNRRALAD